MKKRQRNGETLALMHTTRHTCGELMEVVLTMEEATMTLRQESEGSLSNGTLSLSPLHFTAEGRTCSIDYQRGFRAEEHEGKGTRIVCAGCGAQVFPPPLSAEELLFPEEDTNE